MKLYLVSQDKNNGYDTYDSFVCAAKNENEARLMHPDEETTWHDGNWSHLIRKGDTDAEIYLQSYWADSCWTSPNNVTVKYIGTAITGTKAGVICSSYNAG